MIVMLDTNSCIFLFTGRHAPLTDRIARRLVGEVSISSIVLAELMVGMERGHGPTGDQLEAFVRDIPVRPFDVAAARAYGRLPFRRDRVDHLIAAHALSVDAILVTANVRDFAGMPGLKVEDWTIS